MCGFARVVSPQFLESLVENNTSVCMIQIYVSALTAMSVVYNLNFTIYDHPCIKYIIKSLNLASLSKMSEEYYRYTTVNVYGYSMQFLCEWPDIQSSISHSVFFWICFVSPTQPTSLMYVGI